MAKYFKIKGGQEINGTIRMSGAKNSVLALLIASILTDEKIIIEDFPNIQDVSELFEILKYLGSDIKTETDGVINTVIIDNQKIKYKPLLIESVTLFRASYYFMGAMVSKFGKCELLLPGGCYLGPRPIDLHLKGFKEIGYEVENFICEKHDAIRITKPKTIFLENKKVFLDFPSVGATMNIILSAVFINGKIEIENTAKEPEIVDLVTLLNTMGANIKGAGTDKIIIIGVNQLKGCYHQVIPDRIEAGSYLMLAAIASSEVVIENVIPEHLEALTSKLTEIGVALKIEIDKITVFGLDKSNLEAISIKTGVFPSFPTDLQQIMTTLLTQVNGESKVMETIYVDRFRNCIELNNMGANIEIQRKEETGKAIIFGKTKLVANNVKATDLRAGFSLVFAAMIAIGESKVYNIEHVLRGYDNIVNKLNSIGASIELIED